MDNHNHYELLLTALEPLSHHDPNARNESNTLTFLRLPQLVDVQFPDTPVLQSDIDAFCVLNPVPESVVDLVKRFNLVEFVASAYVRLLIDVYNSKDGTGLFSGVDRYKKLDERLQTSAIKSSNLRTLWDSLTTALQLPIAPARYDAQIASFFNLPPSLQYQVIVALTKQHQSIATVARLWHAKVKEANKEYTEAAGKLFEADPDVVMHFSISDMPDTTTRTVLSIPAISANGVRHQLVRYPAWLHLCERIGIDAYTPGEGELKTAVETLFDNGGNIESGVKLPDDPELNRRVAMFANGGLKTGGSSESSKAYYLASLVRKAYPSLGLLGGTCNAFDLGESNLKVSAWIVCRENADAIPEHIKTLPEVKAALELSVFDLLTEITRTRQAERGEGQMIYNYEALVKGTLIYVDFQVTPVITDLERGALVTALNYYADNLTHLAGQGARGHGRVSVTKIYPEDDDFGYTAYLDNNSTDLRSWLLDGSMGTDVKGVVK